MTRPKYVPGKDTTGITAEELVKLRNKARAYLRDPNFTKLKKDLQEDVLVVALLDRLLGTEVWRASERVSADSRGRFVKIAEDVVHDIEKREEKGNELLEDEE